MKGHGIDESTARVLIAAEAVIGVRLIAQGQQWSVEMQPTGHTEEWMPLVAARGHIRVWRSLDTLIPWLKNLGVTELSLDATGYLTE